MECTQRLNLDSQEACPDQIGFLEILNHRYHIKNGPNKIGRDPIMCTIVLNLESISRLHAVINVMSANNFVLMDLDSLNKTQLSGQILPPYRVFPLQDGDVIQFGNVSGIFKLLDEQYLPMTQVLRPRTAEPVFTVNLIESDSSEISDTDSYASSQLNSELPALPNWIAPRKKTPIKPTGTNKINNNINKKSPETSTSMNDDDFTVSPNGSLPAVELNKKENKMAKDIHDLQTRMLRAILVEGIIDLTEMDNTQCDNAGEIPTADNEMRSPPSSPSTLSQFIPSPDSNPSIHDENTQLPGEFQIPSVHTLNTPVPVNNMQIDHSAKECDRSIHNAQTQFKGNNEKVGFPTNSQSNGNENVFNIDDICAEDFFVEAVLNADEELLPSISQLENGISQLTQSQL